MKKQYIQPNISSSQMVSIQSVICISVGVNISGPTTLDQNKASFTAGNSDIEIGTKERNEWGNIGGDDMTYGSIW